MPENFKLSLVPGDGNCLFEAVARAANFILPTRCTAAGLRHDCVQTIQQVSLFRDRFADDLDLSNFCKGMAREATYGDELCVRALAHTLGLVICVHSPEFQPMYFGDVGPCVHIGYNGYNHYDAEIPRLPACPASAGFAPSPLFALPAQLQNANTLHPPSGGRVSCREVVELDAISSTQNGTSAIVQRGVHEVHGLTITSANITSWNTRHQVFSTLGHHVLCFQETRLNEAAKARAAKQARFEGKRLVCGHAVSQQGGVAIQAPSPLLAVDVPKSLQEWDRAGRIVAAWLPLANGHRSVLVISVYGIPGSHPQKCFENFALNEQSLGAIFEWLSTFGDVPCFLCGDFNIDPSLSPACLAACASGRWHALGAESGSTCTFEAIRHGKPAASRIDAIFCNKSARATVTHFEVVELDIPNHKALKVCVSLPAFSASVFVLRRPNPLPLAKLDTVQAEHAEGLFTSMLSEWQQCLELSHVDQAWGLLCRTCCLALHDRALPPESDALSYGSEPRLRKRLAFPLQCSQGCCSVKVLRPFKLQRRIQEALL